MSFCPKCGNELGDWVFCNKCGTNVEEYLASHKEDNTDTKVEEQTVETMPTISETSADGGVVPHNEVRKCPKCGNEIGEWMFCNKCGTNVSDYAPTTPTEQVTPFANSVANGNDFFSQYTPTSIDLGTESTSTPSVVEKPKQDNRPQPEYQPSHLQSENSYLKSSSTTANNNTNKKPMIIAASIIGVLTLSVIILVVVLLTNKSKVISNSTEMDNEVSNYNSIEEYTDSEESNYILMPACENKKYSTVKTQLEDLGFIVDVSYEFSDDVEKDYVIYQMDAEGSQLHAGDTVSLTVSKGSDACPYDYEQKLTVTASSGSSYATAVLYEWQNGDWTKLATYDATVGSNGIGNTREGSSTSPKGIHKLGVVLSSNGVSTNLDTYTATRNTCVIDDTKSPYYNQIMEKSSVPSNTHYDNIGKGLTDGTTYATIYIEHNGSGFSSNNVISGNGSAIGLRGQNGSLSPTYGDVDISASDMRDLLSRLDANKNPVIELKTK